jgi:predicted acetyltransferase
VAIEIRTPEPDEAEAVYAADARAFGGGYEPSTIEEQSGIMELDRFKVASDRGAIVGVVGAFSLEMTLPGGATVPTAGVTWVGVAATHRRQGLLSRLMEALHDDAEERGDPIAALTASESAIYERFGYGAASRVWVTRLDRARAAFRPDVDVSPGSVRYVEGDEALAHVEKVWERYRRTRPGEVARVPAWQEYLHTTRQRPSDGMSAAWYLAHADGYAIYRNTQNWDNGHAKSRVDILELVATTPEAHAALWHVLTNVDLVSELHSRMVPIDDPLPYLLRDFRALRTVELNDGLWICPLDAATAFGARTYSTTDTLVVELADAGERLRIEGSPEGATVKRVRTRPDLVTDRASAGALLLGGVRTRQLVAGGRLTARNDAALARADLFFQGDVQPHCQTLF